jgi:hypothetical protein
MGWASGGEVFDPVARAIVDMLADGDIQPSTAELILSTLIVGLQAGDWDTECESLDEFAQYPIVVKAFGLCGITRPPDAG